MRPVFDNVAFLSRNHPSFVISLAKKGLLDGVFLTDIWCLSRKRSR